MGWSLGIPCRYYLHRHPKALRQQQLDLRHRVVSLQEQIERQQARLWSQQMQISVYTSPKAVIKTLNKDMAVGPEAGIPPEAGNWVREETD